ncbi:MAG: adenosine deaminase [Acidimicrobiia bacterium]|nr:adenosine deaminase [Acidimicrobiia bacterium]
MNLAEYVRGLPKAELHMHIEGTLEPEMLFELAQKNDVELPFVSVAEVRAAYDFDDLQSFLDIYYAGAAVLITEEDFAALMRAYLERAIADGVRRAEMFFDPQTHTQRGIDVGTVIRGFRVAMDEYQDRISTGLIMCFLRHLGGEEAVATFEAARPYLGELIGVGLDSSEVGFPPELFVDAYALARQEGLRLTAHAAEEAGPDYVWGALNALGAERIDHGVQSERDPELIERLVQDQIPLTMCPISNRQLKVFANLGDHNLKRMLDRGVKVTINSDDPAYFGGYIGDNYIETAQALGLTRDDLATIARNSIEASFLDDAAKSQLLDELATFLG